MSLTLGAVLFEDRFRSIGQHRVLFIVDIGVHTFVAHTSTAPQDQPVMRPMSAQKGIPLRQSRYRMDLSIARPR